MYDIIVFAHLYKPHIGGLEKYVENFYKNLSNKKVLIITSKYNKDLSEDGEDGNTTIKRIDCIEMVKGKYFIPTLKGLKQINKIVKENKGNNPEIHTHTRFYLNNWIATFISKRNHLTHYHFEHGASLVKDGSLFVRLCAWIFDFFLAGYILKNSKLIFPVSDGVREFLQSRYSNLKYGPTIYNSYPFLLDTFPDKKKPEILKLLFVGRIIQSKGIYELIDACVSMNENRIPFSLTVIGDGSEMSNIKRLIKANNLSAHISMMGLLPFEETQKQFAKYDIFINPSYTEGLPTTVLEALANGLFVVATDVGGTKEIIPPERLIDLRNLSGRSIKGDIIHISENWNDEIKIYKDIYNTAKNKFSWKENIKKYEQVS
jgi:glycosyltransferase involved in cell wall biosynthesis